VKQIGSSGPAPGPGVPARPSSPFGAGRMKVVLPLVLGVVLVGNLVNTLVFHHENRYERLASDVTRAIAADDMRPVEKEFNAIRRPQLEDRAKVGSLSDFVNAEGKLKKVRETTPGDAKAGTHRFIATFEKGERAEDLTVDADGKIVNFHVTPIEAK